MLQDTEDPQGQTRYDRKSTVEATNGTNAVMQGVIPTFTKWTSATMVMRVENGTEVTEAYAADRYSLNYYNGEDGSMNITNPAEFVPRNYIGRAVYAEQVSGSITSYRYLGTIVQGDPSSASVENSENASGVTRSLSDNDPAAATASGNDPGITTQSGTSANLYVYNRSTASSVLWAKKVGETYTFESITDGKFLYFTKDANGEYYVSKVSCVSDADFRLSDVYTENAAGRYVKVGNGTTTVKVQGIDADFIAQDTYDFIGDNSKNVFETVTYSGGFYNKEWFKKEVLNLSGSSRYEKDTDYSGEVNDFNIEVTTLTLAQLAELTATDSQAYYGIDLDDVDLIYLSGRGSYAAESVNMTSAATALTKMIFGIKDTTGERNNADRVPVVMDYGFYSQNKTLAEEPNNNQNNKILTQMALTILKVSDDSIAKEVASQGDAYWNNGQTAASLSLGDSVKEALYDNVYLNDDSATPYVASDFLTDCKGNAAKAATFGAVLKEIQYENFLAKKNNNNAAQMVEEISKASITRYILNWYMHRVTVKSSVRVLDLEPCYDFKSATTLNADRVKEFMGRKDTYTGSVEIKQMSSAEFIGKVEDLNEKYDMIYLGAQVGAMNTDSSGNTVYNDTRMNGLIYSHVGDYYDYSGEDCNDRNRLRDASLNHKINNDSNDLNNSADVYRGPGNDMNSTRYKEFMQFVQAGYPVVIADKLLNISSTNGQATASTATMDKNSYFYQIVDFMVTSKDSDGNYLYWQKNVYAESQLLQNSSGLDTSLAERQNTFCNYMNLSKLSVEWVTTLGESAYPAGLTYGNEQEQQNQNYMAKIDGKYQLQYIFTMTNDAASSQVTTTYDCKLFVDKNADGRFAGSDYVAGQTVTSSEELTGLRVYVRKGSGWQSVDQTTDSGTAHYKLQMGNVYKVVRQLPDDYVGVIPWKLVFYDNADRLVRTAQSGYTAVPQQSGKKNIKILQLLSDKGNNWNLEEELNNSNSTFHGYIADLKDWDVNIKSISVTQLLQTEFGIDEWNFSEEAIKNSYERSYNYFQNYDMLIIGFADSYRFGYDYEWHRVANSQKDGYTDLYNNELGKARKNMAVGQAVQAYIEAGRSVLFTHDTTSYVNDMAGLIERKNDGQSNSTNSGWYWGYEFNKTIRAAVGLDRYGELTQYYAQMADRAPNDTERQKYQSYLATLKTYQYDTIKEPNTDIILNQREGLTKYTVVRFWKKQLETLRVNRNYTGKWFPVNNALLYDAGYREGYGGLIDGWRDPSWNKASYMLKGTYAKEGDSELALKATQVNEGQITQYPYLISKDEQKSLKVSATHYQWLQPNMELDRDGDGKNDIVVWYCLSDIYDNSNFPKNIYNICPNDVVNNYYIYNMRNVTYSGAGHSKPDSGAEMKLFVNTMIAAYNAGISAPSVAFKDDKGYDLSSIYVISDPVNNMVLKAKDQGNIRSTENGDVVSVKFRAEDDNILSGNPQICVEFYKSAGSASDAKTIEGISEKVVPLNVSSVKDSSGNVVSVKDGRYEIGNNLTYTLTYPLSEMGLFDGSSGVLRSDAEGAIVYVRVYILYENGTKATPSTSDSLTISAQELFELN